MKPSRVNQEVDQVEDKALTQLFKEILAEIRQLRKELKTPQPPLVPVEEAAKFVGCAPKTLRNRLGPRAANPFPVRPIRHGSRVLFRLSDLQSYIDQLAAEGKK